ncbi:MAG: hypothetical protein HQL32_01125 [Planctomycetes bacterium]|nr:hypothetical protein [Planctomycetota bacterium]
MSKTPYSKVALHMMVNILTNLDRDSDSPTYGSFDRNMWNYKMRDFSSALLQQGSLTLALAYKHDFEGNIYFNNKFIREYAIAGIRFLSRIQLKCGGFEEYWAHEKSIPSTGFALYAMCETYDVLELNDQVVLDSIRRAVRFIHKYTEHEALNQEMAATAAMYYAGKVLDDDLIINKAEAKFKRLMSKQDSEGWFKEYNGVDVGYLSVFLDFLIRYYELSQDSTALEAAKRIILFIQYFIHPDGSLGGEYCTRNTEYFLPYGFEYMKRHEPIANSSIIKLMSYINRDNYLNICLDERYILHYTNSSYMKAIIDYKVIQDQPSLPHENTFNKTFNNGLLHIRSTDAYYFICSIMKSGVFKVMNKKDMSMSTDTCYRLYKDQSIYTSEWPCSNPYEINKDDIIIHSGYIKKKFLKITPIKLTLLKVLSYFTGRFAVSLAKNVLIFNKQKNDKIASFTRKLALSSDKIMVQDTIDPKVSLTKARRMNGLSLRHTASSKFFQVNSLQNQINQKQFEVKTKTVISDELTF